MTLSFGNIETRHLIASGSSHSDHMPPRNMALSIDWRNLEVWCDWLLRADSIDTRGSPGRRTMYDLGKDQNACGGLQSGPTRQWRESVADHGLSHLVDLGDGSNFEEAASPKFDAVIAYRLVVSEVEEWITQRVNHADQP